MSLLKGHSSIDLLLRAAFWTGGYLPGLGLVPMVVHLTTPFGLSTINMGSGMVLAGLTLPIAAELGSRMRRGSGEATASRIGEVEGTPPRAVLPTRPKRVITLGGMNFDETDCFYNFMVTGSLGSGKTSSILMPAIEQLLNIYNVQDYDPLTEDPYAAMGGFSADVKGEFYEPILLFVHRSGRNVFRDCRIIRVRPNYPIVKFYDPDSDHRRYFYLSAMSSSIPSDCARLTSQIRDEDGEPIPSDVFTWDEKRIDEFRDLLEETTFELKDPSGFRFLGWRNVGGKLRRVHYHRRDGREVFAKDQHGKPISIRPPTRLKFVKVIPVSNGMRRNIVRNHLPSGEAAERLAKMAELLDGNKSGGEGNPYFGKQAGRLISACLELKKVFYPNEPCDAPFIYSMTVDNAAVDREIKVMADFTRKLQIEIENSDVEAADDKEGLLLRAKAVQKFFESDWKNFDQKTKSIVGSVVSGMMQPFTSDPWLNASFCAEDTYSFKECTQYGRIFCFVPGGDYKQLGRVLGAELKVDHQATLLSRINQPELGQTRRQAIWIDEYQQYAIAGSSTMGDDSFTALARQARAIFVAATQSYAWLETAIGRDASRSLLQSFTNRIWLQNNDLDTNKIASELCGTVAKNQAHIEEQDISLSRLAMKENQTKMGLGKTEDRKPRFRPDDFTNLGMLESISFNKGEEDTVDKVVRHQNKWHWIGGPSGKALLAQFLPWYFQGEIECCLEDEGRFDFLDPDRPDALEGTDHVPAFTTQYEATTAPSEFRPRFKKTARVRRKKAAPKAPQEASDNRPANRTQEGVEAVVPESAKSGATVPPKEAAPVAQPRTIPSPLGTQTTRLTKDPKRLRTLDKQARAISPTSAPRTIRVEKPTPETPQERPKIAKGELEDYLDRQFSVGQLVDTLEKTFGARSEGDSLSITHELSSARNHFSDVEAGFAGALGKNGKIQWNPQHHPHIPDKIPTPPKERQETAAEARAKRVRAQPDAKNTTEKDADIRRRMNESVRTASGFGGIF